MRFVTVAFATMLVACGGDAATTTETPEPEVVETPAPAPAPAAFVLKVPAEGTAEARGLVVFTTNCVACHQADGSGMNGMLAADFRSDPARLAKPDEELLTSIREGKTGKVGAMPPWGQTLSEEQMTDALAYVRFAFGAE